jgi:glycosyltransferase involved in cell wall biosynthesis
VRVLCLSNMYPGPGAPDYGAFVATMADALERRGLEVERVVIDTRARGPLRTSAKYLGLAGRAAGPTRRADVIYGHYLFPTGAIAAGWGRMLNVPWVLTAHGQDVANLSRPSVRRATAPAVSGASGIIAVSRYLATELRASGLPLPPVTVANMGVDMQRFVPGDRAAARARLRLAPEGEIVLFVGGLTARKNPLVLLQAFARVRAQRPRARLVLVGGGPLRGAIVAGVRRLGLDDVVILTGAVPNTEVVDWMAACDLLALPSLVEPLGVVALEALASGRPVVATRVGGVSEIVPAPRAGALVNPSDPVDVAAALVRVLDAPPRPEVCREAAMPNSIDRQAAKVEAALMAAAGRLRA